MQKWEYKTIEAKISRVIYDDRNSVENEPLDRDYINHLGTEGWELVTVFRQEQYVSLFYFKRPSK